MKPRIKNLFLGLLALAMAGSILGCDTKTSSSENNSSDKSSSELESSEIKERSFDESSLQIIDPSSSESDKEITHISISSMPNRTSYYEGEKFDKTGLKVNAFYDDGSFEEVTDFTIDKTGELTTSDTKIKVQYQGCSYTIDITVSVVTTKEINSQNIYLKSENNNIYLCVSGVQYGYTKAEFESGARLYLENHGTYDDTNDWSLVNSNGLAGTATVSTGYFEMKYRIDDIDQIKNYNKRMLITHFSMIYTQTSSKSTVYGNCRINIPEDSYVYEDQNKKMYLYVEGDFTWNIPTITIEPKNSGSGSELPAGAIISSADEPIVKDDPNKVYIGDYGDYVEWVDKSKSVDTLLETYRTLRSVEVQNIDEIYELAYEKGLIEFFDIHNKIEFDFKFSDTELNKLQQDHIRGNRESYRIGDLTITLLGMRIFYKEVGIRQKGNTSRGDILNGNKIVLRHYKMKFKDTFDDEYTDTPMVFNNDAARKYRKKRTLFGMEKLDLRRNRTTDLTYLREYYAYEGFRQNGGLSARSNLLNMKWHLDDGSTQNLGVYLAVECLDDTFTARNFTSTYETGDLYKVGWNSLFNGFNASEFGVETLHRSGNSYWNEGYKFDLKTNKKTSKHEAAKTFIENLNKQSSTTIYGFINSCTDYNNFLVWLALAYLNGDQDDLRGDYNNTYWYLFSNSNKCIFLPTDNDQSLGAAERDGSGMNATGHHGAKSNPFDSNTGFADSRDVVILKKTIYDSNSKQIRSDYLNKINEVLKGSWFDPNNFKQYFDLAKGNYENCVTLGNRISGYHNVFNFEADKNPATIYPMDISTYLTMKEQTFYAWCRNNGVTFSN